LKGLRPYSRDFTSDFKVFNSAGIFDRVSRITGILRIAGILGILGRISGILGQISGHCHTGFQK